jgi:hypothetical protein
MTDTNRTTDIIRIAGSIDWQYSSTRWAAGRKLSCRRYWPDAKGLAGAADPRSVQRQLGHESLSTTIDTTHPGFEGSACEHANLIELNVEENADMKSEVPIPCTNSGLIEIRNWLNTRE